MTLINPDDHDRMLIDPAYRLWKHSYAEEKMQVTTQIFNDIERRMTEGLIRLKNPFQKVIYESCIEADKAFAILERHRKKVQRYLVREYLDSDNHERRERRMKQLAKERWENNYTFYYGGLTEEEQRYNDYFLTDNELHPEDEMVE
jgi:hypothetical protein